MGEDFAEFPGYVETVYERAAGDAVGDVVGGQCALWCFIEFVAVNPVAVWAAYLRVSETQGRLPFRDFAVPPNGDAPGLLCGTGWTAPCRISMGSGVRIEK